MSTPPKWAQDLTLRALLYAEEQGYPIIVPTLEWKRFNREDSSGSCWLKEKRILVRGGRDRQAAKLILLHELAHHITGCQHTRTMWTLAWQLYRWAKLPIRFCSQKEGSYMKGALVAYRLSLKREV